MEAGLLFKNFLLKFVLCNESFNDVILCVYTCVCLLQALSAPGAVGVSIALEKLILVAMSEGYNFYLHHNPMSSYKLFTWAQAVIFSWPLYHIPTILMEAYIVICLGSEPDSSSVEVLVCSKGGGGLLRERMEIVSELWDGSIKASIWLPYLAIGLVKSAEKII